MAKEQYAKDLESYNANGGGGEGGGKKAQKRGKKGKKAAPAVSIYLHPFVMIKCLFTLVTHSKLALSYIEIQEEEGGVRRRGWRGGGRRQRLISQPLRHYCSY